MTNLNSFLFVQIKKTTLCVNDSMNGSFEFLFSDFSDLNLIHFVDHHHQQQQQMNPIQQDECELKRTRDSSIVESSFSSYNRSIY